MCAAIQAAWCVSEQNDESRHSNYNTFNKYTFGAVGYSLLSTFTAHLLFYVHKHGVAAVVLCALILYKHRTSTCILCATPTVEKCQTHHTVGFRHTNTYCVRQT